MLVDQRTVVVVDQKTVVVVDHGTAEVMDRINAEVEHINADVDCLSAWEQNCPQAVTGCKIACSVSFCSFSTTLPNS